MKFFIDTANLNQIREAAEFGVLDGVTTNPSLMAKEGVSGEEAVLNHYKEIAEAYKESDDDVYAFPAQSVYSLESSEISTEPSWENYPKLEVGEMVSLIGDNSKGKVVAILSDNNYEIEIEAGFIIPLHRESIEKISTDESVDNRVLNIKYSNFVKLFKF